MLGIKRSRLLALTGTLLLAGSAAPIAQSSVSVAEAFVRLAYDELVDDSLGIRVTLIRVPGKTFQSWDRLPDVYVQLEHGTPRTIASPADTDQQLLGVFVSLDVSGRVFSARGEGTYLRRRELNDMQMFANEHADWSEYELIEELKTRGARFPGNADQFRQAVRLNRFEQVIGTIQETALRFELRRDVPDRPPIFDFRWIVNVETERAPSVRDSFVLVFEPFDGRLVSQNRR